MPAAAVAAVMWAWLVSWFISSGMPIPPGPPGTAAEALKFATTRDDFWRHVAEAMTNVFQQGANASQFVGDELDPARWPWWPPIDKAAEQPIDVEKLKTSLGSFSKEDKERIVWAVQWLDRVAGQVERNRKKTP